MKKLLLIAFLMLALVITAVACTETPDEPGTSAEDVTTAETPTEAPTDEPSTPAPETDPETPAPETDPETPAPETDEPETPAPETEPETEPDPSAPVLMLKPEDLHTLAGAAAPNVNQLGSSEVITEGSNTFVRWTAAGGDPYVAIVPLGSSYTLPQYMAIRYRTNSATEGQFFVGSGAGWSGNGDSFMVTWVEGDWNFVIVDLTQTGVTSITDGLITYARMDFFAGDSAEGDYFDVAYVGVFNAAEDAQKYDFELTKAPHWTEAPDQVKHQSFDQLYAGTGNADNGPENIFTPGASADWDFVVDYSDIAYADFTVDTLTYWGWIGFMGEKGQFGYQIDMNPAVYNDEFAFVGGDHEGIIGAAQGVGADSGHRMKIAISIAGLEGEHTVRAMYKTADGMEICLNEFTVKLPARPTHYDNYNVPQDLWTVTGHCTGIVGKEGHANSGMVAAGGVESGALIHQGAVSLGEIDLSKYDKAVIMWGCDNSPVTVGHYENSANNRIMLVSADVNGTAPAEETIIAGGTYELGGWAVQAFEIDLTEVDYNGPVYLCIDTLPGTFALFASVEFIGGEIDYSAEEPEVPEGPKVIGAQAAGSTVKHISQDGFRYLDGDQNVVAEIVTPGQYDTFDGTLEYTKGGHPCVADFGWVAMNCETFQFGYIINDGEPIMNDVYATPASDPVKEAAASVGASNCSAFYGVLVVGFLPTGEHNIKFVMQQDGGDYVIIREYTVIVSE